MFMLKDIIMIIGVPKEIKSDEYRVAVVPSGVKLLEEQGHEVLIEKAAGEGSGFSDREFEEAGATIVDTGKDIFEQADMIVKVKEPIEPEYDLLNEGKMLFTFLHLARDEALTKKLVERKIIGIAYETVETDDGELPLLTPMSEIAGRLSAMAAATCLERSYGGKGILMGGCTGVSPANVVVLGAGSVGRNAAKVASAMGANVVVMDRVIPPLRHIEETIHGNITTRVANEYSIREAIKTADVVIGAVLVPGSKTPCLISREMLKLMEPGSVIVDTSIDQGGCVETSHPTSHSDPAYEVDGVIHYCVTNLPGCVPRTSTLALTNVTLPYILELANKGWRKALRENKTLARGLNVCDGKITYKAVATLFNLPYQAVEELI